MPLPCPHLDGYQTSGGQPNDEIADLLQHLGTHYPPLQGTFDQLAGKMRDLPVAAPGRKQS